MALRGILRFCFFILLLFPTSGIRAADHQSGGRAQADRQPLVPRELECTPLHLLLLEAGGQLPVSDAGWERVFPAPSALRSDVAFSSSLASADLLQLRRVYAPSPVVRNLPINGLILNGQVFLARGRDEKGAPQTEFMTLNRDRTAFLFGTINPSRSPAIQVEPLRKCNECHKTEGPFFTVYPWTNTLANPANFFAHVHLLHRREPKRYQPLFDEVERLRSQAQKEPKPAEALARLFRESEFLRDFTEDGVPLYRNTFTTGPYGDSDTEKLSRNINYVVTQVYQRNWVAGVRDPEKRQALIRALVGYELGQFRSAQQAVDSLQPLLKETAPPSALWSNPELQDRDFMTGRALYDDSLSRLLDMNRDGLKDGAIQRQIKVHEHILDLRKRGAPILPANYSPRDPKSFRFESPDGPFPQNPLGGAQWADGDDGKIDFPTASGILPQDRILFKKALDEGAALAAASGNKTRRAVATEVLSAVLDCQEMTTLYRAGLVPDRASLLPTALKCLQREFRDRFSVKIKVPSKTDLINERMLRCQESFAARQTPADSLVQSCIRCHGSGDELIGWLSDLGKWGAAIQTGDAKAIAAARKVRSSLKAGKMPPDNTVERTAFEGSREKTELLKLLQGVD